MAVTIQKLLRMTRVQLEQAAAEVDLDHSQYKSKQALAEALLDVEVESELTPVELLMKRVGRPSKYDPRYCIDIVQWMSIEKYATFTTEETVKYNKEGNKTSESKKLKMIPADLPTLEGFARSIGVTYETMRAWAHDVVNPESDVPVKKHPEFSVAYNIAKQMQKEFIIDNGLKGNYPPASYIFTAKNITDMTDKQIIETKDTDYKDKHDALTEWFNTLRHNVITPPTPVGSGESVSEDVQE